MTSRGFEHTKTNTKQEFVTKNEDITVDELITESPVQCISEKGKGRYLVATRDLAAGEIVMSSIPYTTTVSKSFVSKVCHNCFKEDVKKLPHQCQYCKEVFFCSENCKKKATMHEGAECDSLRRIKMQNNGTKFSSDELSDIRTVICTLARRHSDPASNYHNIDKLVCNRPTDKLSAKYLTAMAKFVVKIMDEDVLSGITDEDIIDLICKIRCNAFGLWNKQQKCFGTALSPPSSFFNHSCMPNCARSVTNSNHVQVRTIHPVKSGQELCISYVDPKEPIADRKNVLLNAYYFDCTCRRCIDTTGECDRFMQTFYCTKQACNGLLVPTIQNNVITERACKICSRKGDAKDNSWLLSEDFTIP
jgi:SET and MYND domain-containing protein